MIPGTKVEIRQVPKWYQSRLEIGWQGTVIRQASNGLQDPFWIVQIQDAGLFQLRDEDIKEVSSGG
jgi:hypothetical protein